MVDLTAHHPALLVVGLVLGYQVAAVTGGVQADVLRRQLQRAFQHAFQVLVLGFTVLEGNVVAVHHETLGALAQIIDDLRQVHQVVLFHLDHAQPARRVFVQQRFHQRRLAGAPAAPQQRMVGGLAGQEAFGVLHQLPFLRVHAEQIVQRHRVQVPHRSQPLLSGPPDGGRFRAPINVIHGIPVGNQVKNIATVGPATKELACPPRVHL